MKAVHRSILILVVFFATLPCLAQSQPQDSSASSPPASAKPAPAPAKGTTATPEKKKPKKVWTNDDVSSIPGSVSVVGDASKSDSSGSQQKNSSAGAGAPADDVRQKQIDGYKDQIRQLQSQIDAADKSIAQLKNFKGENNTPSGGINMNQGYNMVPVEDQVKQLEDKKKQMQAKIEDVENEARKNGIDSGDLR
jgi:hypothetical protein